MTEEQFLDVAAAILDGTPVAWDTLPEPETEFDRGFLDQLRLLADVTRLHRAAQSPVGTSWGPLLVVERIGSGTFGEVYRASDPALDRDVALKLLRSPAAGRHLTEGRLLARVRHPNVVTVFGAAEHEGVYGVWMEFIQGRTVAALVAERGPFTPAAVTAIGVDVCRALAAVHASGLLHGDIKAQNLMREDGGRIVLMDFGTGRLAGDASLATTLAGTPLYVAPEVLDGEPADAVSDIYSVGVLLYFLLTGAFPVEGRTLNEVRGAHAADRRISVRERRLDVPRRLAAVVDRATARAKRQRYQTATDLEAAVAAATRSPLWRRPGAVAVSLIAATTAIVAALTGTGWLTLNASHRSSVSKTVAATQATRLWSGPELTFTTSVAADSAHAFYVDWTTGDVAVVDPVMNRRLRLTHNGTWFHPYDRHEWASNLTPSNDGRFVAFAWGKGALDALSIARVDGTGSSIVYRDPAISNIRPSEWSRDGRFILVEAEDRDRKPSIMLIASADGRVEFKKSLQDRPGRLTISPDGRHIAYDARASEGGKRNIVIVSVADGHEMAVLRHPANNVACLWAPDGHLYFLSDRTGTAALWRQTIANGTPQGVAELIKADMTRTSPLSIDASGTLEYAVINTMADVFIIDLDVQSGKATSIPSPVGPTSVGRNRWATWSPDGKRLAYGQGPVYDSNYSSGIGSNQPSLRILSVDSGTERELQTTVNQRPRWSPDGHALLVIGATPTDGRGLYRVDVDTGKPTLVVKSIPTDEPRHHQWLPDGSGIIYKYWGGPVRLRSLVTGVEREISPPADDNAELSRDGRVLAYSTHDAVSGVVTLWVLTTGGGSPRELTRVRMPEWISAIAWTPTNRVVFAKGHRDTLDSELYSIGLDGGSPMSVGVHAGNVWDMEVSPDGHRLAYSSVSTNGEIWTLNHLSPVTGER